MVLLVDRYPLFPRLSQLERGSTVLLSCLCVCMYMYAYLCFVVTLVTVTRSSDTAHTDTLLFSYVDCIHETKMYIVLVTFT